MKFSRAFPLPLVYLLPIVNAQRTNRCIVPDPGAVGRPEVIELYLLALPDIACISEEHKPEPASGIRAKFSVEYRHAVAACRRLSVRALADNAATTSPPSGKNQVVWTVALVKSACESSAFKASFTASPWSDPR